ncbi:hypothetical protein CR513_62157, partial [Mucuna pruriens]
MVAVKECYFCASMEHLLKNHRSNCWSWLCKAAMAFTVCLHHMGYFVREPNMHYKEAKNSSFEKGLKELVLNKDALELSNYAMHDKCEVDIYIY